MKPIDRQDAIDLLDNLIGMVDDNHGSDYDSALRMGIEALKAEEPNLQQTCNQLATDTISRQAAIDALKEHEDDKGYLRGDFEEILEALPSAEPETSRIEQELHGKTPEEQYEFVYWLLFKSALNYSNSRLTIIEWLRGEKEDG